MENIALPFGKVLKGDIIGPIKASKDYVKTKLALKKYEKKTGVKPLNKLHKKVFHSNQYFVDMSKEISNPLIKVLKSCSANTTDVYFNENDAPVLSCSYSVKQNLINKNTTMICNCISTEATMHSDYYYLTCCIKYNVVTNQTSDFLTLLMTKV